MDRIWTVSHIVDIQKMMTKKKEIGSGQRFPGRVKGIYYSVLKLFCVCYYKENSLEKQRSGKKFCA